MSNVPKIVLTVAGAPKHLGKADRDQFRAAREVQLERFRRIGACNGVTIEVVSRGRSNPTLEFFLDGMPEAHALGVIEAMSAELDLFADIDAAMRTRRRSQAAH